MPVEIVDSKFDNFVPKAYRSDISSWNIGIRFSLFLKQNFSDFHPHVYL